MQNNDFSQVVEQIKDKLDIVDIVSETVILKKSGNNYWGLCPFHNEKTPSFSVNPQKQIYKCFGCGEGGDVFSFIMKTSGASFHDVIKEYATKFGIELPSSYKKTNENPDRKKEIHNALNEVSEFYCDILLNSKVGIKAYEYLKSRQINDEIIKKYKLGFALNEYDGIQKKLGHLKPEVLKDAGLIVQREGNSSSIDRFRNRIMIPVFNEMGEIVAFGARAIEEKQSPKYLNSPDTVVYNKSKILYGLYHAKEAIKEEDGVVIMEGYFDVISAQMAGVKNCVASCGTSLTLDHVKLMSKYTPSKRIYMAFDLDKAGKMATKRNANVIKEAFGLLGEIKQYDESYTTLNNDKYVCELRVINLPNGKDPDEFIRQYGAQEYKKQISNAPLFIDYQVNTILSQKKEGMTPQEKTIIVKQLIEVLSEINNEIILSEYIKMSAKMLDIKEESLYNELKKNSVYEEVNYEEMQRNVKKTPNIAKKAQKNLLSVFIMDENVLTLSELSVIMQDVDFSDEILKQIKNTIDKLACRVNNVSELQERLYIEYAQNSEIKNILSDLVYLSESWKELSEKDLLGIIYENINKIKTTEAKQLIANLKKEYALASDDETKRQCQLRIQEHIKIMRTGESNV